MKRRCIILTHTLHLLSLELYDTCAAGTSKGFFESSVGAQFATKMEAPKKAAPRQAAIKASSAGFFDNSVGAQFATRKIELPKKAATNRGAARKASSGGFFDSSVGAQFATTKGASDTSPESFPVSTSDSELSDTEEDVAEEVDSESLLVSAW